jgi:methionyl-tRNA formyltransferase
MDSGQGTIVFWGTPAIAAECLRLLITQGEQVVGVVSQPDKPVGRAQRLTAPPVKIVAVEHGIACIQPATLKTPEAAEWLAARAPEACLVVAYGKIIPSEVLKIPSYFLNLHFSFLPAYRGAAPVQHALIDGRRTTGVTVQHVAAQLDTGDSVYQLPVEIDDDDTTATLLAKCVTVGAPLIVRAVRSLRAGDAPRVPQDDARASYAPKLTREDGVINWQQSARAIHNRVRACNPWPGATVNLAGDTLKIWRTAVASETGGDAEPGVIQATRKELNVTTGKGMLRVLELQPAGRAAMPAAAFIAGHDVDGKKLT